MADPSAPPAYQPYDQYPSGAQPAPYPAAVGAPYPPPGQAYAPPGQYPPPGAPYPPPGAQYPPGQPFSPPPGAQYPPHAQFPPNQYPPNQSSGQFPPQPYPPQQYPPAGQPYAPAPGQAYAPGPAYPPAGAPGPFVQPAMAPAPGSVISVMPVAGNQPGIITPPPGSALNVASPTGGTMLVLTPPTPYVPPVSSSDPSLTALFKLQNTSLMSSETNYTAAQAVTDQHVKNFIVAHSIVPDYTIEVEGYHYETTHHRDANGHQHTSQRKVVDWSLTLDPRKWIQAPGNFTGIDEAVKHFLTSTKSLKKLTLQKRIIWQQDQFTGMCRALATNKGYRHHVDTHYRFNNNSEKITIHGGGDCHEVCDSSFCKCLLCITCLCIIWSPLKACCCEDSFIILQDLPIAISPENFLKTVENQFPTFQGGFRGCTVM